jgi:Short C-terminal domain
MGIGDVVGGLLIYDTIQEWRAERQFSRQLSANMDRAQAEYVTWRRARPADIRALLPLEFAYRWAIRPVMDRLAIWSPLAESFASLDDVRPDMFIAHSDVIYFMHEDVGMPLVDHLRAVAFTPGGVDRKLDTPYVRALAASSESAQEIWRQAAAYAWLLVRLIDALAARDVAKIGPVAAEYDRFAPTMHAFWTDLYPVFATVLRWQRDWDRLVPHVGLWEEYPFVDKEDLLTGWKVPQSWERTYDEAIAAYENPDAEDEEEDEEEAIAPSQSTIQDRLAQLDALHASGAISDDEHAAKRTKIIDEL